MLLQRERAPAPARALMPAVAPLPSLPDALRRRAAIFGPIELDADPVASRAPLSRRGVIVGALIASALTGAAAVALQDAGLCAAEAEVHETDAALAAIFATAYEDTPAEAEADRLSRRWVSALRRMAETPAAGPAGLAAKARVVGVLSGQGDLEMVGLLAPSLAADALRLEAHA